MDFLQEEKMTVYRDQITYFRKTILKEISYAFGFPRDGWQHNVLAPFFWLPANKFSKMIANFDQNVETYGLAYASDLLIQPFVKSITIKGIENIPRSGAVVITSNHPGAYDGFLIVSNIPREDIKVVVSGVPFLESLPASSKHLIYTSERTYGRMQTMREIIRHLRNGGILLTFPSGRIDPDPAYSVEAESAVESWSHSLEVILRRVPETKFVPTKVSGVLSKAWMHNPIVKIPHEKWRQQKLAEFFQIMQQIFFLKSIQLSPQVIFGEAFSFQERIDFTERNTIMQDIINKAKILYKTSNKNARSNPSIEFNG